MSMQDFTDKQQAFNKILLDNRQFGTGDTEVMRKKLDLLQSLYNLDPYIYIPKTAAQWELYNIDGANDVAQKLTNAAKDMVTAFDSISVADLKKLKGILIFDKETVTYQEHNMAKKSKLQSAAITLAEIVLTLRKTDPVMLETILEEIDLSDEGLEEALDAVNL